MRGTNVVYGTYHFGTLHLYTRLGTYRHYSPYTHPRSHNQESNMVSAISSSFSLESNNTRIFNGSSKQNENEIVSQG